MTEIAGRYRRELYPWCDSSGMIAGRPDSRSAFTGYRFLARVDPGVETDPAERPRAGLSTLAGVNPSSWASSPEIWRRMQATKSRDTKPELVVRRKLHAGGLRYRVSTFPTPEPRHEVDIVVRPSDPSRGRSTGLLLAWSPDA